MNHAGHLSPVFGFYRQAVSSVPHGDDCILQISTHGSVDHGIQGAVNLVVHLPHGPAHIPEGAAGVVRHGILRQDTAADLVGQGGNRL